jgi:hypothetical protein
MAEMVEGWVPGGQLQYGASQLSFYPESGRIETVNQDRVRGILITTGNLDQHNAIKERIAAILADYPEP